MSVQATESTTGGAQFPWMPQSSSPTGTEPDKEMFLKLLVTQLRYQDPLNPTDSSQFLAQSAQFTSLEKMQDVADRTGQLLGAQMAFGASGLVGRNVSWISAEDGVTTLSGTVDGVTFGPTGPVFDIDGTDVPIALILTVTQDPAHPAATPATDPQAPAEPTTPAP
jgi:flagellar basal-body rod modification protein FlgD